MQDYFAFSRTEMRGATVLLLLTTSAIGAMAWWSARGPSSAVVPPQDWRTLDSLVALLDSATAQPSSSGGYTPAESFPFDPNRADSATLTRLGLKPWIAQRVLRYRAKGGAFRVRADFKKIYGLAESTYQRLYTYIQLPERLAKREQTARPAYREATDRATVRHSPKRTTVALDINTADTTQLKKLSGIGSTLSARIVKFRRMLGGFHRIEQLREVYHMTDQGWASLQESAYVSPENAPQRMNINRADAQTLAQHPYISWDIARAIVDHRQDYGEYHSLDDLKEVYLMTPKLFEKTAPYLEI